MAAKRSKRRPSKKRNLQTQGMCFVIMPFGGWFDSYWKDIYQPAIEAAHLAPRRADDLFRAGNIMSDVWRNTREARVILADLSTINGNVYYELGLAHAIGKPTVLVAESLETVPFDLRGLRIVVYDRNAPDWGTRLREEVRKALVETLEDPAASVPITFVEEREHTTQPTLSADHRELLALRQDVEHLKRQLGVSESVQAFFPPMPVTAVYHSGKVADYARRFSAHPLRELRADDDDPEGSVP